MRERIFLWLRRFILERFEVAVATERRQEELARLMKRRRYMYNFIMEMLRQLLEVGDRILEVGIGRGNFAHRLRENLPGPWLVGLDPAVLTANPAANALVQADGRQLPFDDGSFPVVVSTFVLHHLIEIGTDDPLKSVSALVEETLRVGKTVLIADIVGGTWTVCFASIGSIVIERLSRDFAKHTFRVMAGCLTRSELETLARKYNLELSIQRLKGVKRVFPKVAVLRTPA